MTGSQQIGEYLAPHIKVIELKSQHVLCQSGDISVMDIADPQDGDDNF